MYESERFNFGAITLRRADRPTVEELHDAVERWTATGFGATTASGRESADSVMVGTDHDDYSYCHFRYHAHPPGENTQAQPEPDRSRVFYFENGQFAVQPIRGLSDRWLPAFIGRITDTELDEQFTMYSTAGGGSVSSPATAGGDRPTIRSDGDPADLLDEAAHRIGGTQSHDAATDTPFPSGTVVVTWSEADWPNDLTETRRVEAIHERIVPTLRRYA